MFNHITGLPDNAVVLDTETTGFDPESGDRIVEFGAVKIKDGLATKEKFHAYVNPERPVPADAVRVHGLTSEFLARFEPMHLVIDSFIDFIGDLPMIAHNMKFDSKFINYELQLCGRPLFDPKRYYDSLDVARKLYPGSPASLDALAKRHNVSLKNRDKHGALIDSEILAEVLVEMSGGRQTSMFSNMTTARSVATTKRIERTLNDTFVHSPTEQEIENHLKLVKKLGDNAIWNQLL